MTMQLCITPLQVCENQYFTYEMESPSSSASATAALDAVRAASSGASIDARLDAAEIARQCGVDGMEAVATALKAPRPASSKRAAAEEPSAASPTGKKQKVELTPREKAQLRLIATVPQLAVSRDARGRRRGVSVNMSEHLNGLITGDLSAQVSSGSVSDLAAEPAAAHDAMRVENAVADDEKDAKAPGVLQGVG